MITVVDVLRDAAVAVYVLTHQREALFEAPGVFSDLDHRDVEVVEHARVARAGDRQAAPGFELLEDVLERPDQQRVFH